MKRSELFGIGLVLVLFVVVISSLTGCALFSSPQAAFVSGVDAGANGSGLLDEYDKYVEQDYSFAADYLKRVDDDVAAGKLTADQAKKIHATADPLLKLPFNLSPDGKKIHHDTAAGLRKLIKDAQASAK